jgi:hypothetical protein
VSFKCHRGDMYLDSMSCNNICQPLVAGLWDFFLIFVDLYQNISYFCSFYDNMLIKKNIHNICLISILFLHSSETYKNICLSDSCPIGKMGTVVPLEPKCKFEKCRIHIIIPIHILKVRKLDPLKCYSVICDPFISI